MAYSTSDRIKRHLIGASIAGASARAFDIALNLAKSEVVRLRLIISLLAAIAVGVAFGYLFRRQLAETERPN